MTSTGRGSSTAIGELALLDALRGVLAVRSDRVVRWIGDDCAVVRADGYAAVSTDVMVDGTHFRLGEASYEDVGWRALGGGLSAFAGMGARASGRWARGPVRPTCRSCSPATPGTRTCWRCTAAPRTWPVGPV